MRANSVGVQSCDRWFAGPSRTAGRVFLWYGRLASFSPRIANIASDQHQHQITKPLAGEQEDVFKTSHARAEPVAEALTTHPQCFPQLDYSIE